jgi:hypothetical protein
MVFVSVLVAAAGIINARAMLRAKAAFTIFFLIIFFFASSNNLEVIF